MPSTKSEAPKSRLGRGLSSLIGSDAIALPHPPPAVQSAPDGTPREILLSDIRVNPHQPRRIFTEEALRSLADSIKSNGIIQPILVRPAASGYELIAGERRWRASKLAGRETIPAMVISVDALTQAQMALVENIQREDLNPIERAEAYKSLMSQLGLTQAELASRMGEDRSSIANHLRLLDLSETAKKHLRDGALSLGHAKLLAGIPDILEQDRLANLVITQHLSVRNLEKAINLAKPSRPAADPGKAAGRDLHYQEIERKISAKMGLKVNVHPAAKGSGKVVLRYKNLDQFDALMTQLGIDVS